MSRPAERLPLPVVVALGAVLWGVILMVAWGLHPVEAFASYRTVENPTATEQASIDRVLQSFGDGQPDLVNRLRCDSTPFQAARGSGGASGAPSLEAGFEYVQSPCSSEYGSARAAFWLNALAIAVVILVSVGFSTMQRNHASTEENARDDMMSLERSDEPLRARA